MLYFLHYLVLISIVFILKLFPFSLQIFISDQFGLLLYYVLKKRRNITLSNIRCAFPNLPDHEIINIAKKSFGYSARIFSNWASISKLKKPKFFQKWIVYNNPQMHKEAALGGGIIIMGHIGSWELQGTITLNGVGLKTKPIYPFAKRLSNPWVNSFVEKVRNNNGMGVLYVGDDNRKAMKLVKNKQIVAFLADQYAPDGYYVPFLNRLASTFLGPALFAGITNVPVYFSSSFYNKNKQIEFDIEKIELPNSITFKDNKDEWIKQFTYNWVQILEKKVKENPESYYWVHNRWKNQPNEITASALWKEWEARIAKINL